jgi:hypothetical protein
MGTGKLANRSDAYNAGAKVLKGRWVYDHKKDSQGIMFVKARYTVMGCFQTAGVDYGELYAPVMNLKSFRTMLQLWNLDPTHEAEQWDIKGAYLYAKLDEEVYCDQPIGHEESSNPRHCWRLVKSLYGLKQAGRNFNKLLTSLMKRAGFEAIPNDPGTFIRKDSATGAFCTVCMHVDDLWLVYNPAGKIFRDELAAVLGKEMTIKFLGELDWALKCRIQRDREAGILRIDQEAFVLELLSRHGLLDVHESDAPAEANTVLPAPDEIGDEEFEKFSTYPIRELIGAFLWLCNTTRPDIEFATISAARVQHRPSAAL